MGRLAEKIDTLRGAGRVALTSASFGITFPSIDYDTTAPEPSGGAFRTKARCWTGPDFP